MDVFNGRSLVQLEINLHMNTLISKGISNIYSKVTTEKKFRSHIFDFLSF